MRREAVLADVAMSAMTAVADRDERVDVKIEVIDLI